MLGDTRVRGAAARGERLSEVRGSRLNRASRQHPDIRPRENFLVILLTLNLRQTFGLTAEV